MRNYLFFIIISSIIFLGCKKKKEEKSNKVSEIFENYDSVITEQQYVWNKTLDSFYSNDLLTQDELLSYGIIKALKIGSEDSSIKFTNTILSKIDKEKVVQKEKLSIIYQILIKSYIKRNDCENAVNYSYKLLDNFELIRNVFKGNNQVESPYLYLALAYRSCNDYQNYRKFLFLVFNETKDENMRAIIGINLGDYYLKQNDIDSAIYHLKNAEEYFNSQLQHKFSKEFSLRLGETQMNLATAYNIQNSIDSALVIANKGIKNLEQFNTVRPTDYVLLARLFFKNRDYYKSDYYFREALRISESDNDKIVIYNNYSYLFEAKKDYKNTIRCMDSIIDISERVFDKKLVDKTKSIEENFLINQKDLSIKQLQLKNEIVNNQIKIRSLVLLITLFIAILTIVFLYLYFKNKRLKEENARISIEQKLFTSQMSPHFMFNALSAIQAEVLNNNSKLANNYLTKFGQLLQSILSSTTQEFVSIYIEYKNLLNYIELQEIRFKNFSYICDVYEGIDSDEDFISPMFLQPLVENAIEHGLKELNYKGVLTIVIRKYNGYLDCEIKDNGVGLQINEKAKLSLSTQIMRKRLQYLSKSSGIQCQLLVENNVNETGVVSKIRIPVKSKF